VGIWQRTLNSRLRAVRAGAAERQRALEARLVLFVLFVLFVHELRRSHPQLRGELGGVNGARSGR